MTSLYPGLTMPLLIAKDGQETLRIRKLLRTALILTSSSLNICIVESYRLRLFWLMDLTISHIQIIIVIVSPQNLSRCLSVVFSKQNKVWPPKAFVYIQKISMVPNQSIFSYGKLIGTTVIYTTREHSQSKNKRYRAHTTRKTIRQWLQISKKARKALGIKPQALRAVLSLLKIYCYAYQHHQLKTIAAANHKQTSSQSSISAPHYWALHRMIHVRMHFQ
jgi:hypothetical protein